jgi:hypothetical protein
MAGEFETEAVNSDQNIRASQAYQIAIAIRARIKKGEGDE